MSAASSACDHIHDWFNGTPPGKWVSMGVYGDGSYGQPAGLIYSYPVTCQHGKWKIVQVGLLYTLCFAVCKCVDGDLVCF
jgi:malate dehydrogenase